MGKSTLFVAVGHEHIYKRIAAKKTNWLNKVNRKTLEQGS